jgi:hypothetical protein
VVNEFGHFSIKRRSSIHPLHDALLQNEAYEKFEQYKRESRRSLLTLRASLNKLSPVFLFQLDNYGDEHKNHYLFFLTSILTSKNIFTIACVSLLRVGHTHEHIDGNYGRLSAYLKRQDILSFPHIMDNLERSKMRENALHT